MAAVDPAVTAVVEPLTDALSPLESSPVAVNVAPPASDKITVRRPEPLPKALAPKTMWPLEAEAVKFAGKLSDGAALRLAVPCALAGQETLKVVRLVTVPSAPLTVTVSG